MAEDTEMVVKAPRYWDAENQLYDLSRAGDRTLRDDAALAALQGLLASARWSNSGDGFAELVVVHAGNIADAFMAERAKGGGA